MSDSENTKAAFLPSRSTGKLYACVVTDCWETWQESLHETKAGAWRAGRDWLLKNYEHGHESRRLCGKMEFDFMNKYQSFRVVPVTVRP